MSRSGEFVSFDEALSTLQIDEARLRLLVSEGEIRAFREGDELRFRRVDVERLAQQPHSLASLRKRGPVRRFPRNACSIQFFSFDETLKKLNIDETRLKRLVSDGEIRAFREADELKFRRSDVEFLAQGSAEDGTAV